MQTELPIHFIEVRKNRRWHFLRSLPPSLWQHYGSMLITENSACRKSNKIPRCFIWRNWKKAWASNINYCMWQKYIKIGIRVHNNRVIRTPNINASSSNHGNNSLMALLLLYSIFTFRQWNLCNSRQLVDDSIWSPLVVLLIGTFQLCGWCTAQGMAYSSTST